jgi:hypothetical protein
MELLFWLIPVAIFLVGVVIAAFSVLHILRLLSKLDDGERHSYISDWHKNVHK